jgi:hypothetical protein
MLKILSRITRPRYFDYGPLIQIPVVAVRIYGVLIWTSDGIALPARRQVRAGVTRDRKLRQWRNSFRRTVSIAGPVTLRIG